MISDTQIFVALILALVSLTLAIRLGVALYD
jgi:photosystem I reaction center subunit XII|nr:photosystem I reaction center subunit M [Cryptomonas gyropyrenoidosa]WFQ83060.1 photosystem I reaction center subunit M [Cryptomonas gyropyrenoidosa]